MTEHDPPRWLRWAVAATVLILFGLHLAARDDGARWYGDAAQYTLHAENLVAGRPYAATGSIQNAGRRLTPVAYPPGYPVLLAPVVAVTGRARAPIAALQAAFLMGAVWLFAILFWRRLSPGSVLALVLLCGLSPFLGQAVSAGTSDLAFLAVVAFAFVAIDQASRAASRRRAILWGVAAGVAGGGAVLVRALGVVVLPAFVLPVARRSGRSGLWPAVAATGVAVGIALVVTLAVDWEAGGQVVTGPRGRDAGYDAMVSQGLIQNAGRIPHHVYARVVDYAKADHTVFWSLPLTYSWLRLLLRLTGVLAILVGAWVSVRKLRAVEVFAGLYLVALLPWSFGWPRYLMPLLPIGYAFLLIGGETVWSWARERSGAHRAAAAAVLTVCFVLLGSYVQRGVERVVHRIAEGPSTVQDDGANLVRRATPPDAIVLTTVPDPRPLVFASGRSASATPADTTEWFAYADRVHATFLLATDGKATDRYRALADAWAVRSGWRLVARDDVADLYAR